MSRSRAPRLPQEFNLQEDCYERDGKDGFADFAAFSFEFVRVRCALVGAFLVRSWCGFASSAQELVGAFHA